MPPLHNPHPGEILKLEFLDELGMSQNRLARATRQAKPWRSLVGVPPNRIHAIVKSLPLGRPHGPVPGGARDITADSDLRLCKFFGLSEGYFLRLQNAFDTLTAKRKIAAQIAKIKRCVELAK